MYFKHGAMAYLLVWQLVFFVGDSYASANASIKNKVSIAPLSAQNLECSFVNNSTMPFHVLTSSGINVSLRRAVLF